MGGNTVLHAAVSYLEKTGCLDQVEALTNSIRGGNEAAIDKKNDKGRTPRDMATARCSGSEANSKRLIEYWPPQAPDPDRLDKLLPIMPPGRSKNQLADG